MEAQPKGQRGGRLPQKTDVSPALGAHSSVYPGASHSVSRAPSRADYSLQITQQRRGRAWGEAPAFTRSPAHAQMAPFTWGTCPGPIPMPAAKRAGLNGCLLGSRCRFWELPPMLSPFSLVLSFPVYSRASPTEVPE